MEPAPWPSVRQVLAVTLPAHAALPIGLWAWSPDAVTVAWTLLGLHLLGLVALVGAWPWWRHRVPELALVLVLDHVVTLGVASALLP